MFLGKKETVVNVVDIDMVIDINEISAEINKNTTKEKDSELIN